MATVKVIDAAGQGVAVGPVAPGVSVAEVNAGMSSREKEQALRRRMDRLRMEMSLREEERFSRIDIPHLFVKRIVTIGTSYLILQAPVRKV